MKKIILILLMLCSPVYASTKPWFSDFIKNDSIVIVKSERKLYYFDSTGEVRQYPVAIGKAKTPSPTGEFKVAKKVSNPTWYPPDSIRYENPQKPLPEFIPPGPDNPLGPRAIYFSSDLIRIHGTNKPSSIGKAVSHGCFRMKNEDVVDLYNKVAVGTSIYVFK